MQTISEQALTQEQILAEKQALLGQQNQQELAEALIDQEEPPSNQGKLDGDVFTARILGQPGGKAPGKQDMNHQADSLIRGLIQRSMVLLIPILFGSSYFQRESALWWEIFGFTLLLLVLALPLQLFLITAIHHNPKWVLRLGLAVLMLITPCIPASTITLRFYQYPEKPGAELIPGLAVLFQLLMIYKRKNPRLVGCFGFLSLFWIFIGAVSLMAAFIHHSLI